MGRGGGADDAEGVLEILDLVVEAVILVVAFDVDREEKEEKVAVPVLPLSFLVCTGTI